MHVYKVTSRDLLCPVAYFLYQIYYFDFFSILLNNSFSPDALWMSGIGFENEYHS